MWKKIEFFILFVILFLESFQHDSFSRNASAFLGATNS
jgi:hypothetical protein